MVREKSFFFHLSINSSYLCYSYPLVKIILITSSNIMMFTEKINKINCYMPLIRITLIWSFPVLLRKEFDPKE